MGRRIGRGFLIVGALAWLVALLGAAAPLFLPQPAVPTAVVPQLRFLRAALDGGAGEEMQALFPEGDYFSHVLYGLAWVNVGLQSAPAARAEAISEARWAYAAMDSERGRAPFRSGAGLAPAYGIFYRGWQNYLLAGILLLQPPDGREPAELARFERESAEIAAAFEASETPFLPAYPGSAWPVDSFPAIFSLRAHATLVDGRHEPLIERWLASLDGYRDPATGLLPHRVEPTTGALRDGARATSQTLILRFLAELDAAMAARDYARFRADYVEIVAGLPGVLEYPRGVGGSGDVDSGPLVRGVSLSATVVMLGTARVVGDEALAGPIERAGEFLGLPVMLGGEKRYALGQLPVGDAFLAWSKSSLPWLGATPAAPDFPPLVPWWWRLPLLALTLLLALQALWVVGRAVRRGGRGDGWSIEHGA